MKDNKKTIITILIIIFIITMLGLVIYNFYKGYKEDKIKTQEKINNINTNYNNFINDLNELNNQRTIIYNEIFQDNYYSDMNDNISNWNNLMDSYNELINKIDNNSKYLKENCNNLEYYHLEITPKCDSFVNNYEMMINYYISDVTVYNNNIDSYNLWITENFIESSNIIDKFDKNVYTEYIDFDNDGVFLGKE